MGEAEKSTALTAVDTEWSQMKELAVHAAESRFFGFNRQQAFVILVAGRDLGMSMGQSLRSFHIIEGKPTLTADAMVGVCKQHHEVCEYFRQVEVTPTSATWETKRKGEEPQRYTFTIEDAKTAKLYKPGSNWEKHPSRMCSARAKAFLARDVYPDILAGLYDPEELAEAKAKPGPSLQVVKVPDTERPQAEMAVAHDADGVVLGGEVVDLGKTPQPANLSQDEMNALAFTKATGDLPKDDPGFLMQALPTLVDQCKSLEELRAKAFPEIKSACNVLSQEQKDALWDVYRTKKHSFDPKAAAP